VRKIMEEKPDILKEEISGMSFVDALLTPHRAYYMAVKDLFESDGLVGLAHITGGGMQENLDRILPKDLNAQIDLAKVRVLPIFKTLKQFGQLDDADMLRTFNMGVGMCAVVRKEFAAEAEAHMDSLGVEAYELGTIVQGKGEVEFTDRLQWA
jgi:phosphoribosylformylglycinamidine cyclo-ligase